ncbi:MAG: sodium-dependent transporter [Barnesiella sp.]|nr:sodium-dependent transporter [Barnesiella sp.]
MATKFSSKIGLIAATVGSAVGLGNVWRFPAETQTNGGAAFLLIYILCVLLLGIPVMLGEFAIGREGGTDAVGDYKRISPRTGWWLIGAMGLLASYMILCFYIVVAGWTLEYFISSLTGSLYSGAGEGTASFAAKMQDYAAYFPRETKLKRTATIVSLLDMLVAVLMGLIIFPAVTSFGMQNESLEGATLVFVTLPEVFTRMPGTQLWSSLFFILLLVAALTSTISIAEVSVRFCQDRMHLRRRSAVLLVMLPVLLFGSLSSLSMGSLSSVHIFGLTFFDFLDTFATNILLPLGSMAMCIYAGWFAPKGMIALQLDNGSPVRSLSTRVVLFIIKWIAPVAIAVILVAQFN